MELKNYPAPYVLFGALLALGNRLQAAGDRFYDEITTKQWFCLLYTSRRNGDHRTGLSSV